MRADGIVRRFDDLGRIVIPREFRKQIFGTPKTAGIIMEIFIDGENIILRKYEDKVVEQMDEDELRYCHHDDTDEYHDCLDYMECEECPYYYADLDQESDWMITYEDEC